jgi:hypothetical protein
MLLSRSNLFPSCRARSLSHSHLTSCLAGSHVYLTYQLLQPHQNLKTRIPKETKPRTNPAWKLVKNGTTLLIQCQFIFARFRFVVSPQDRSQTSVHRDCRTKKLRKHIYVRPRSRIKISSTWTFLKLLPAKHCHSGSGWQAHSLKTATNLLRSTFGSANQ